jgi:hypothetical protein
MTWEQGTDQTVANQYQIAIETSDVSRVEEMENAMKYAMLALMIMIPAAIAGVIFLVGTGTVKIG